MKDHSTFHLHHPKHKQTHMPHAVGEEAEVGNDMDEELTRMLGTPDPVKVPEAVLQRLWFRLRLFSLKNRN